MKFIIIHFLLLIIFLGSTNLSLGQNPPKLKDVEVYSQVEKNNEFYFYKYKIKNSAASTDSVFVLEIDMSLQTSVSAVDTTGLLFENSFMEGSFRRFYPALEGKIVPVGFLKAPARWGGEYVTFFKS